MPRQPPSIWRPSWLRSRPGTPSWQDQQLRAQAEVQNARRRAEDEVTKARKFAIESFAESLLPVTDSLEAGLAHQDGTAEQVREGAEATLRQLKAALERNKVLEINPAAGDKFDPHQHQAISVVPAPEQGGEHGRHRAAEGLHDQRPGAASGPGHCEFRRLIPA